MTDNAETFNKISAWRFSIAPMMDWSERQKTQMKRETCGTCNIDVVKCRETFRSVFAAALVFGCAAGTALADDSLTQIAGRAVVQDGDTLVIAGRQVRLQGLDAPETGQACETATGERWRCGAAASWALDAMIAGRSVACRVDARDAADRYGRALGHCSVAGADINLWMVEQGHAVAYHRYLNWPDGSPRPHKAAFVAAENAARLARRGVWQGRFTLPDEWRRAYRGRRQPAAE